MKVNVIGDSHIMLFQGSELPMFGPVEFQPNPNDSLKDFDTYYITLLRAYNIFEGTTDWGGSFLFELIQRLPKENPILISAGEIDCRGPILNVSHRSGVSIEKLVEDCVKRYLSGIEPFISSGWNIILYSPIPNMFTNKPVDYESNGYTLPGGYTSHDWCLLKKKAVLHFDKVLKRSGIPVISLLGWIIEKNIYHKEEYWKNITHLNEKVLPQLIIEFEKIGINISFERR
jgi:hypothetical protein